MTRLGIDELIEGLPAIDLATLDAAASLQTRRDRKYLVPLAGAARLVAGLAPTARVLAIDGRRTFRYASVYFDTHDRRSYTDAARGRPHRFKVRTRTYLDSGVSLVEVKTRGPRGDTIKQRQPYAAERRWDLDGAARRFVGGIVPVPGIELALRPALETHYRRVTLLLAGGSRLTIDRDLVSRLPDGSEVALADLAIVETKSVGAAGEADRALWAMGCRPIRISKYCTSLAVLDPALPANRWTRALGQPWAVVEPSSVARVARTA